MLKDRSRSFDLHNTMHVYDDSGGYLLTNEKKDHVTLQEVSTFAFVPEGLSKWELDDVWIDNWMCIKVLHR
jgi:hypothetical protein